MRDLTKDATSLAKAGFTVFKIRGKRPSVKWRHHPYTLPSEIAEHFKSWHHNYGVAPTKNQLVIDIDPRNFERGDKPLKRLFDDLGIEGTTLNTPIILTGGGGYHIYLNIKTMPPGMKIKKNPLGYKGLDFISDGAYVVGPGSLHPETHKEYTIQKGFDNIDYAPQSLIDFLLVDKQIKPIDDMKALKDDDKTVTNRFKSFLETTTPASEGDSGDLQTFRVACSGRDFALSRG